ncbi:MAG: methyltransferase family protein [Planctomycetota bacterium]
MFLIGDLPQTVVALTVWSYWTSVCVLVVRSHIRYRTPAGGLPRTAREQWMWGFWVPAIVLWQIVPALAASSSSAWLATPSVASSNVVLWTLRLAAAGFAVLAFGLTIPNWFGMGRNWSMAIVPGKRCRLITSGMFSYVRHPIYALSILLMLATVAVTLSPAMAVVGAIHITMLCIKATSEERYLKRIHGEDYAAYCKRTGRFFPRLRRTGKVSDNGSVREAA